MNRMQLADDIMNKANEYTHWDFRISDDDYNQYVNTTLVNNNGVQILLLYIIPNVENKIILDVRTSAKTKFNREACTQAIQRLGKGVNAYQSENGEWGFYYEVSLFDIYKQLDFLIKQLMVLMIEEISWIVRDVRA